MAETPTAAPQQSDLRYFVFRHRDHIPIPVAVAAIVGLFFYHPDFVAGSLVGTILVGVAAALSIFGGEGIRIWSVGYSGTTTRSKSLKARSLATQGPYAAVRNPIYVGNFLLGLGFVLLPRVAWLVGAYVVFFAIQYSLIVSIEEEFLTSTFGDEYTEYKARTPRFFPTPRSIAASLRGGEGFNWRALRGERWTILNMLFCGVVVFAVNQWLRTRV